MKKVLRKSFPGLIVIGIIGLVSSLLYSLLSLNLMDVIDLALASKTEKILSRAGYILVLIVSMVPLNFLKVISKTQYTKKTMLNLKSEYISRLFQKDINEFQEENNGKYLSNLTNDMESIEQKYTLTMVELVLGVIDFLVALLTIAYVQPLIIGVSLILAIVMVTLFTILGKPLQKPEKKKSETLGRYTEYIREILGAFAIIKNNNLEQRISTNFNDYSKSVQDKNYEIDVRYTLVDAIRSLVIFSILIGGLTFVIVWGTQNEMVSAGAIMLVFSNFSRIINPLFQLSELAPKLTSVNLLFEEMDKTLTNHNPQIETLSLDEFKDDIQFKDVAFDYGDNLVFDKVNLTFESHKKYLIIGPSGQGKSTLLKLLRKYFAPTKGVITIDQQDFIKTKKIDFFHHLSNIEQQVFLFEDTIRNNITLYKPYEEAEVLEAINKAGLQSVVSEFRDGLDHVITDNGKNISGGQKARIAIARGLITKSNIILLDEAFASLDEPVAKQIEQTLLHLENVMVINVSHVVFKESMDQYDSVFVVNNQQISQHPIKP